MKVNDTVLNSLITSRVFLPDKYTFGFLERLDFSEDNFLNYCAGPIKITLLPQLGIIEIILPEDWEFLKDDFFITCKDA